MAGQAFAGTLFFRIDGVQQRLSGDFKVQPNARENTGVAGPGGVLGYTQKYLVPSIEGTLADSGGLSVQALQNITDSTITCELVNGKSYVLSDAWYSGTSTVDVMEGKVPVKFEGISCRELVAA